MSKPVRHHALQDFLGRRRAETTRQAAALRVAVQANYHFTNLRGHSDDPEFLKSFDQLTGQSLPIVANTWSGGAHAVYWLGPDEWLVVTPTGDSELIDWRTQLAARSHQRTHALSAQDGGLLQLNIKGPQVMTLLAGGCTIDLHPRSFKSDACVQTGLGKANVLIARGKDTDSVTLIVRRSFAEYVALWLEHAGAEFGIDFVVDT